MITAEEARKNAATYEEYSNVINGILKNIHDSITFNSLNGAHSCTHMIKCKNLNELSLIIEPIKFTLSRNGFHVKHLEHNDCTIDMMISW